jgi:hypothetical protein
MPELRFATAQDLFAAFPTAAKDVGAAATAEAPLAYLGGLRETGQLMAGLVFCAYLFDRRQTTRWTCKCLRGQPRSFAASELEALNAAEAWVERPEEQLRMAAHRAALRGDPKSPATHAAYAAAFAGPGLRPPFRGLEGAPPIPIAQQLTAQSARSAFLLAQAKLPASEKNEYLCRWLDDGVQMVSA